MIREEIEKAIKTCIAIEQSCGEFDGNRLTKKILEVEDALGVVIKIYRKLPTCGISQVLTGNAQAIGCPYSIAGYTAWKPLVEEEL